MCISHGKTCLIVAHFLLQDISICSVYFLDQDRTKFHVPCCSGTRCVEKRFGCLCVCMCPFVVSLFIVLSFRVQNID